MTYTERRAPCQDRDPLRKLFFGDLHVHTRYSWDAYGYDVTVTPREAYGFARSGSGVRLPPLSETGKGRRVVRLERPLDFAAVTDHAEFLGETQLCITKGSAAYASETCKRFRELGSGAVARWGLELTPKENPKRMDICGEDGEVCAAAAEKVWQEIVAAAEETYDRTSSCAFVSFAGYEYTATPMATNLHRNVIFRNAEVPRRPISYYEAPVPLDLWTALDTKCNEASSGCDVMVIPHNSNMSNGTMFTSLSGSGNGGGSPEAAAALRRRMEPIVEIFQHKGDMECTNGLSGIDTLEDPQCAFEKERPPPVPDCKEATSWGGMSGLGCLSQYDFLRGILLRGMKEESRLSDNPFRLGVIGSTDSHNGTPGNTGEVDWPGHVGSADDEALERLGPGNTTHRGLVNNPGGLAAVWAVERSRDAIFSALKRREVYATSGPRIEVRLYGGWTLSGGLCGEADLVAVGYQDGVPMGAVMPGRPAGHDGAPRLVVRALRDRGTAERPGTPLQQVQIVKGWIDESGGSHVRVYVVAGDPKNGADVDLATCVPGGDGFDDLCAVWEDPEFDPARRAYYYARVLENPTCRWSTWVCNGLEVKPDGCGQVAPAIQERAWTSAIWYEP